MEKKVWKVTELFPPSTESGRGERTGFQEIEPFHDGIDLQTDFVMVYGIDDSMPERVAQWKAHGYRVHLMTGSAWGEYQEYLGGKFDGRKHWDEGQVNYKGEAINHGPTVPYMVPTVAFSDFLTQRMKAAVDAGVEAVHMEEPEFWVDGGYSPAFRREWEIFYREPWQAPRQTVDAQYRASKLKAYLYARCLSRVSGALKEYAMVRYGRPLRFYVPTHSLINYTQWRIVSPESKLLDIPTVDGYIAQIWTGTSRSPNVYRGKRRERTFETAYLEYGMMQELTRGTKRNMWFLCDPVEDNPRYTWSEYRRDYIRTLTASLLHPNVSQFEVCPWPNRVFCGRYPDASHAGLESIPREYAALLLAIMNALRTMEQTTEPADGGQASLGVFLADSAMYQRVYPQWDADASNGSNVTNMQSTHNQDVLDLSAFYGLTLPLVKVGLPVRPVQLDNVRRFSGYLDGYRLLVLSYEFMKPEDPAIHNAVAQWVRNGGRLFYIGDGSDSFHTVREWWNQGDRTYDTPFAHLLETLELSRDLSEGLYRVGKGWFRYWQIHPAAIANSSALTDQYLRLFCELSGAGDDGQEVPFRNYQMLRRGPYVIASVMDESVSEKPMQLSGHFLRLLEDGLPDADTVTVKPGEQTLLADLDCFSGECVPVAATMRMEAEAGRPGEYTLRGPSHVDILVVLKMARRPRTVEAMTAGGETVPGLEWYYHAEYSTLHVRMPAAEESVDYRLRVVG